MTGNVFLQYPLRLAWLSQEGRLHLYNDGTRTDIRRCSYRPDVTFIESLILKFDYAIETRRSNRNVASVRLITSISSRIETFTGATLTDLQGPLHPLEWALDSHAKQSPTLLRKTFEPCTGEPFRNILDFRVDYQQSAGSRSQRMNERIGNVSTRNAPGTMALSMYSIACSEVWRNLSSWDLIFKPYVISMTSAPVTLGKIKVSLP
jgi:hypothetical protein